MWPWPLLPNLERSSSSFLREMQGFIGIQPKTIEMYGEHQCYRLEPMLPQVVFKHGPAGKSPSPMELMTLEGISIKALEKHVFFFFSMHMLFRRMAQAISQ